MFEFENILVPRLHQHVNKWRLYVDIAFAYIKVLKINLLVMF